MIARLTVVTYMVTIRRLHDMDTTGWAALLWFVPLASMFLLAMLLFARGTDGPNKYGQPPRAKREEVMPKELRG